MIKTEIKIDWTWEPELSEIDVVWYAKTASGSLLVASNAEFDALIIGDTEEEIRDIAKTHNPSSLIEGKVDITPAPTTLHSLASRWRWFLYKGKACFLVSGKGWSPESIAEYPGVQSGIAPDPMQMVHYVRVNGNKFTHNGSVVIGGGVHDLVSELEALRFDEARGIEFCSVPFFVFTTENQHAWYRGRKHETVKVLARNPILLGKHGLLDIDGDEEN